MDTSIECKFYTFFRRNQGQLQKMQLYMSSGRIETYKGIIYKLIYILNL